MMNDEQKIAYGRFIKARDRIRNSNYWIPTKDYVCTVDVVGQNHPLFEVNEPYMEYKLAFQLWLLVEPDFREEERMRMTRGDYDKQDTWKGNTDGE